MDYQSKRQYLKKAQERYKKCQKKADRSSIIDEVVANCDYSRKHVIRLLSGSISLPGKSASGRKKIYTSELLPHIRFLYKVLNMISSKRMVAALRTRLLDDYVSWPHKPSQLTPHQYKLLKSISPATLGRLLSHIKANKGLASTLPNTKWKNIIPIARLDQKYTQPGHIQADTVAHCGTSLTGEYIYTVTLTDIFSGWTENRAIWTKKGIKVKEAIREVERFQPFKILTFQSDCGTEFLNSDVINHLELRKHKVLVTRGRPYHKNDNCYVEQKNWTHVRELFGYERLDNKELLSIMNKIYIECSNLIHNFFLPSQKLLKKERVGAKIRKKYDEPKTPYQRILEHHKTSHLQKQKLKIKYDSLNPFELHVKQEKLLNIFFKLSKELQVPKFKEAA